jgi:hypothetical protein
MQSYPKKTETDCCNKGIRGLEISLIPKNIDTDGHGYAMQVTGMLIGSGMVSGIPQTPQGHKLRIMPPNGVTSLQSLGACFAILTLVIILIWLPAPDLLRAEEAVTMCFAHQVQAAGANNTTFPRVSCRAV